MLEGRFADSATLAERARTEAMSAESEALADFAHATDTLAVDLGYMGEIDRGLGLLDEAMTTARAVGRLDEVMRCYANRTTLLDLDSRREEALAVVKEGIAEASRNGLGLTYGAFLRGNAADILSTSAGGPNQRPSAVRRWSSRLPAWRGSARRSISAWCSSNRAPTRKRAGSSGQTLLQLETVPAGQWSALVLRTGEAASRCGAVSSPTLAAQRCRVGSVSWRPQIQRRSCPPQPPSSRRVPSPPSTAGSGVTTPRSRTPARLPAG